MSKQTKQQRIEAYNSANPGYCITGIKKLSADHFEWLRVNGAKSLDELYKSYSDAKHNSYSKILSTYAPDEIIGLQGSSMSYSVVLIAGNGDTLWITKSNNYLVEEIEA